MIEKILEWGGRILIIVGIICLFTEAFACLHRRSNPRLTVVGVVFLAISVIGYTITEFILRDQDVPVVFPIVWIAFLWAYLICNVISAFIIGRKNRNLKKSQQQNEPLVAASMVETEDGKEDKITD